MTPAAVIFDYFGTLTPAAPSAVWDVHAARSAAPLGISAAVWRQALDDSYPERAVGALGDLPSTLRELARRCGVVPPEQALAAACAARRGAQRELFALRDDAVPTLRALRACGLAVGVLSDCTVELAEEWPALPVARLAHARVLSCEAGRRKPDPELFLLVARRLGVPPARCLYVGDGGGRELTGASGCGMTAYMLRERDWAEHESRDRERGWSGPVLPSLAALLPLVAATG